MEPDRYQQNRSGYIFGLISLVISIILFSTCAYLFPRIAFRWQYNIPGVIFDWINLVENAYSVSEYVAGWFVFLFIFFPGLIFSIITFVLSHKLDTEIYEIKSEPVLDKKKRASTTETRGLVLKNIFIIILIFGIAKLFQWAISTS